MMSNINQNERKPLSFPEFMDEYDVVIPKIQRDYAQGREDSLGKKAQEKFSKKLVDALYLKEDFPLDFVYGTVSDNPTGKTIIKPLDGQQRLTTLLLLACLYREHKKQDKNTGQTRKWIFKYESRSMTQEFINCILEKSNCRGLPQDIKCTTLADEIKSSEWFLGVWDEDYSVHGMLNMLNFLWVAKKQAEEKYKGIEPDFSRIFFYVKPLSGNDKSFDQIYLKMNARGRALSDWDNLKACIDEYIPEQYEKDIEVNNEKTTLKRLWQDNINLTWPDEIWKLPCSKHSIEYVDKAMETFVALALRAAFIDFITLPEILWKSESIIIDDLVKYNITDKIDQSHFDDYFGSKWENDNQNCKRNQFIVNFFDYCNSFFSILTEDSPEYERWMTAPWGDFFQMPELSTSPTFHKYVLLHYCYKKSYSFSDNIKQLLHRVIWNVLENTSISLSDFYNAFSLLSELVKTENAKDIIKYLSDLDIEAIKFGKTQMREEYQKAKQIMASCENLDYCNRMWYLKIHRAEKAAFFHGCIRFMYRDANGEVNWDFFNQKYDNSVLFFNSEGVREPYNHDGLLIRALLSRIDNPQGFNNWYFTPSNDKNTWHSILVEDALIAPVHEILSCEQPEVNMSKWIDTPLFNSAVARDLIKTQLLACPAFNNAAVRLKVFDGVPCLCTDSSGPKNYYFLGFDVAAVLIEASKRNLITFIECHQLCWDNVKLPIIVREKKGTYINFKYLSQTDNKEYVFQWWVPKQPGEYDLYLLQEGTSDGYAHKSPPDESKNGEEKEYYCSDLPFDTPNATDALINTLETILAAFNGKKGTSLQDSES